MRLKSRMDSPRRQSRPYRRARVMELEPTSRSTTMTCWCVLEPWLVRGLCAKSSYQISVPNHAIIPFAPFAVDTFACTGRYRRCYTEKATKARHRQERQKQRHNQNHQPTKPHPNSQRTPLHTCAPGAGVCVGVRGDAWSVMLSPCNTPVHLELSPCNTHLCTKHPTHHTHQPVLKRARLLC